LLIQILNNLARMPHQMHHPTGFLLCQNQHFWNDVYCWRHCVPQHR